MGSVVNLGGGVKNYLEDDFVFEDARIVGGPCAVAGADKCAALNKHEVTVLHHKDNIAFDLTSIWFYLNGKAEKGSNSLKIFETGYEATNFVEFTQPTFSHNFGYTEALSFAGVTSLTFVSGGTSDQGNARFDSLALSYDMAAVPLPAGGVMLLTALGGLGFARRRKS